ncbi:tyrosine phosphatase-like protein, PTPLA [Dictyocaulus viviparus]|uniref:Very-long-chain (3R)-3-hydroxyacyl-CoA dehydratase n=1 Tax=Dictyocaulus viviparus TaxID=29172 RepID=A0A0D8XCU4_DICVI|nr:tyrosine phosphatase-like protein, PTPLA [Dictyocaulus viviparus]
MLAFQDTVNRKTAIRKTKPLFQRKFGVAERNRWGLILFKTVRGLFDRLPWPQLYASVENEVELFQTFAILEVVHALLGLVRSPIGTTLMQITSRLVLVWPILYVCATARSSVGVPMLLIAWSVTEVIRYSFYALGLFDVVLYFLTWVRYSFFIVLYPLGVIGELLTLIGSLPEVAERKHLTLEMPNPFNMAFSFYWVLIVLAILYIPGFPQLYLYMFAQRKKVLSTDMAKKRR